MARAVIVSLNIFDLDQTNYIDLKSHVIIITSATYMTLQRHHSSVLFLALKAVKQENESTLL